MKPILTFDGTKGFIIIDFRDDSLFPVVLDNLIIDYLCNLKSQLKCHYTLSWVENRFPRFDLGTTKGF